MFTGSRLSEEGKMIRDVHLAIFGDETVRDFALRYLVQGFEESNDREEYVTSNGTREKISYKFLEDVENEIGVYHPLVFRKTLLSNVKHNRNEIKPEDYKILNNWLEEHLFKNDDDFKHGIEDYTIKHVIIVNPSEMNFYDYVDSICSTENKNLVDNLIKKGYTEESSNKAISVARKYKTWESFTPSIHHPIKVN